MSRSGLLTSQPLLNFAAKKIKLKSACIDFSIYFKTLQSILNSKTEARFRQWGKICSIEYISNKREAMLLSKFSMDSASAGLTSAVISLQFSETRINKN